MDSVANCKLKFNGNGKLFEPMSKSINDEVSRHAQAIESEKAFWIGIRKQKQAQGKKSEFYYLTQGPKVT